MKWVIRVDGEWLHEVDNGQPITVWDVIRAMVWDTRMDAQTEAEDLNAPYDGVAEVMSWDDAAARDRDEYVTRRWNR